MTTEVITTDSRKQSWSKSKTLKFLTRCLYAIDRRMGVRIDVSVKIVRTAQYEQLMFLRDQNTNLETDLSVMDQLLDEIGIPDLLNMSVSQMQELKEKLRR